MLFLTEARVDSVVNDSARPSIVAVNYAVALLLQKENVTFVVGAHFLGKHSGVARPG
jgi:hypothetical protein